MTTIEQQDMAAQPAAIQDTRVADTNAHAQSHSLANAKQRYSESLDDDLDLRLEGFQRYASISDKAFLLEVFKEWEAAFMGDELGMAGAFETEIRNSLVTIAPNHGREAGEPVALRPDHPTAADVKAQAVPELPDVEALVREALRPAEESESASDAYRAYFRKELRQHFDLFLERATDAERAMLTEVFEMREMHLESWATTPAEVPLAHAFEYLIRAENPQVFRFPEQCLADVRAYDRWRQQVHETNLGVIGTLCDLMREEHWLSDFLRHLAWSAAGSLGPKGLTPERVRAELEETAQDFTDKIETAREMLREYPNLVIQGEK